MTDAEVAEATRNATVNLLQSMDREMHRNIDPTPAGPYVRPGLGTRLRARARGAARRLRQAWDGLCDRWPPEDDY